MQIESVNTSPGGIPKLPHPTRRVLVAGLEGDGHDHESHRSPIQAVCMIDVELVEAQGLTPGALGENLTLRGADLQSRGLGDRIHFSSGLELEITKVRTPCFVLDSISTDLKHTMWNRIGMYAKVLTEGTVAPGDSFEILEVGPGPRPALRGKPPEPDQ
jgi:MOSC domain-containing protein YiiM